MAKYGSNKKRLAGTHNARILKFLIACICVCLAFCAGFFIRGDQNLLGIFGFESLVENTDDGSSVIQSNNVYNSVSARLAEVEGIITNDSLDSFDLDRATDAILTSLAEVSKDQYLRYYDPERYAAYVEENSGGYAGIGVLFSEAEGHAFATDIFPGSVAESADVRVGDYVIAIDGDRSQDWSLTEVVNAVSRNEGESVVVTWLRGSSFDDAEGKEFTTTLECAKYSEPNVQTEMHETVGYIQLKQVTQNSAKLTKEAIKTLTSQGATAIVLDIRNNPGGYLTQAVEVASLFIKSGTIVELQTLEQHNTTKTASGNTATDLPVVLLVNENTAAAAEVIAAAMKDNTRATIVGHTTLGKGSVQVVRPLSYGGAIRYTAAYYKTPLGNDINGVGVTPDVVVDMGESADEDNQKNLALETAQYLSENVE